MEDNIIKPATFRVSSGDETKFKDFAKTNGLNQAEAFTALMNAYEMSQAKEVFGDRGKEIQTFQDTINRLTSMFINSLEVNQTSEERIREELANELRIKDDTISNLMDQLSAMKGEIIEVNNLNKNLESKFNDFQATIAKLENELKDKSTSLDIANRNNSNLQDQVAEYKEYKNLNIELEKEINQLKSDKLKSDNEISNLKNNVDKINGELLNSNKMIDFYTKEIESKDKSINEYKETIKNLESKHEKEITSLKVEYHDRSITQSKEISDALTSKFELEVGKKDLELEKLKNELDQLKVKNTKVTKKVQDKE